MNNWCICWFFTYILLGILIFKGPTARRLYKSFCVKGLSLFDKVSLYNINNHNIQSRFTILKALVLLNIKETPFWNVVTITAVVRITSDGRCAK
jgi:hypothetical protein